MPNKFISCSYNDDKKVQNYLTKKHTFFKQIPIELQLRLWSCMAELLAKNFAKNM